MHIAAILVTAASLGIHRPVPAPNYAGVWVATARSSMPAEVIRNVTPEGRQWTVIEISRNEDGAAVSRQQCVPRVDKRFKGKSAAIGSRISVMSCTDHLERWALSEDGSELTVKQLTQRAYAGEELRMVFRRSKEALK